MGSCLHRGRRIAGVLACVLGVALAMTVSLCEAKITRKCAVHYVTEAGWSRPIVRDVVFIRGGELNRAIGIREFSNQHVFAQLWFGPGEVAIVPVAREARLNFEEPYGGNEFEIDFRRESRREGFDQEGKFWGIETAFMGMPIEHLSGTEIAHLFGEMPRDRPDVGKEVAWEQWREVNPFIALQLRRAKLQADGLMSKLDELQDELLRTDKPSIELEDRSEGSLPEGEEAATVYIGEDDGWIILQAYNGFLLAEILDGELPEVGDMVFGHFEELGSVTVLLPDGENILELRIEANWLSEDEVVSLYRELARHSGGP